jgi:hypothetical protein
MNNFAMIKLYKLCTWLEWFYFTQFIWQWYAFNLSFLADNFFFNSNKGTTHNTGAYKFLHNFLLILINHLFSKNYISLPLEYVSLINKERCFFSSFSWQIFLFFYISPSFLYVLFTFFWLSDYLRGTYLLSKANCAS